MEDEGGDGNDSLSPQVSACRISRPGSQRHRPEDRPPAKRSRGPGQKRSIRVFAFALFKKNHLHCGGLD